MIASKFGLGQRVRHILLGYQGIIIDVDAEYTLADTYAEKIAVNDRLRADPWYHVVMEDENGQPIHTYLAEAQLSGEVVSDQAELSTLDELACSICKQLRKPRLRN